MKTKLESFIEGFSRVFYGETEREMKARIYILSASLLGVVLALITIGIRDGRCTP